MFPIRPSQSLRQMKVWSQFSISSCNNNQPPSAKKQKHFKGTTIEVSLCVGSIVHKPSTKKHTIQTPQTVLTFVNPLYMYH